MIGYKGLCVIMFILNGIYCFYINKYLNLVEY